MQKKTRGIVINYTKYRETSVIVNIYTEEFGIQHYIENGVRSSRSKNKIALFQPLTLLDLVVYHKENKDIHRISEIKCSYPFRSIPFDIHKSSIALFITEVLGKILKEETSNMPLFDFVFESIAWFDEISHHFENFHVQFLLKLAVYLGFAPESAKEFSYELMLHHLVPLDTHLEQALDLLLQSEFDQAPKVDRSTRAKLLDAILLFYRLHIDSLGEVKSIAILKEVMR